MASASVEGTIQNVTYKDEKSGYTVLKVAALHTAGEPPEQRSSAAQRPSRSGKGVLLFSEPAPASLCTLCTLAHEMLYPAARGFLSLSCAQDTERELQNAPP